MSEQVLDRPQTWAKYTQRFILSPYTNSFFLITVLVYLIF